MTYNARFDTVLYMNKFVPFRTIGAIWGIGGVATLLGFAIWRLLPYATELLTFELPLWQLIVLVIWCVFMIYTEGHQAFGKQLAPRVVARAQHISQHGNWNMIILAPLYCIGYFGAPKKRIIASYIVIVAIVSLVIAVRFVPEPWRAIIDAGVILGISCGIGYLLFYSLRALKTRKLVADPEIVN